MEKTAIAYCRVSTTKQAQENESFEVQEEICLRIAEAKGLKMLAKPWKDSFSGRKDERPGLEDMMNFVRNCRQKIDYLIVRDIDRLTRGGSSSYQKIKDDLAKYGTEIIDSYGLIQPMSNTLEHFGFEYSWSKFSQSEIAETIKADMAKNEVRTILTRLIGSEIRLTQEGYQIGAPNDGYINQKVYVNGKKKTIQVPDPKRAKYYQEMFKLRAAGTLSDKEIVDKINAMGFKTKQRLCWDKLHEKVITKLGGKPLTVKQLQKVIQKPIYGGVVCEKWTNHLPIKAQYPGLVDIDMFNKANRGKAFIQENSDGTLQILYNYHPTKIVQRRNKNNPLFPYKNIILCPHCRKSFLGSSSRGKSGEKFAGYHCSRNHRYYRVSKTGLEAAVKKYISSLRFKPEFLEKLETVLIKTWRRRQSEVLQTSKDINDNLRNLEEMKKKAVDSLIETDNPTVRKELEKRVEDLDQELKAIKDERNKFEMTDNDIQSFISYARYLMEHLEDLLLDSQNMNMQQALFGLLFEVLPTYQEILSGTPKLTLVFELSETFKTQKSSVVDLLGIEPRTEQCECPVIPFNYKPKFLWTILDSNQ